MQSQDPILDGVMGLPALDANTVRDAYGWADAVIVGIPWDGGTTGLPGQRHGPELIRKFGPKPGFEVTADGRLTGLRVPDTGRLLIGGKRVFDIGDLGGVPLDPRLPRQVYFDAIRDTATRASEVSGMPVFIGGDHSITAPIVHGLAENLQNKVRLICFDAHCDTAPAQDRITNFADLTHANFLSYLDQAGCCSNADIVGVRAPLQDKFFPLPEIVNCFPSTSQLLDRDPSEPVYLSIDVDILSPETFPATGHPEAGGPSLEAFLTDLRAVCAKFNVVGADIVETTYSDIWNENSARNVNAIILTLLDAALTADVKTEKAQC